MKLDSITIHFANLETATVPVDNIKILETINISKNNMLCKSSAYSYKTCSELIFALNAPEEIKLEDSTDLRTRLFIHHDIVSVTYNYPNCRRERIYVPWGSSPSYENDLQAYYQAADSDTVFVRVADDKKNLRDIIKSRGY